MVEIHAENFVSYPRLRTTTSNRNGERLTLLSPFDTLEISGAKSVDTSASLLR